MSYSSRVYRQRNAHSYDEKVKEPFFGQQNDMNKSQQTNAFFQAKLSLNESGDKHEREAHAVANAVINQSPKTHVVQQKSADPKKEKMKEIHKKDDQVNKEKEKKKVTPVQTKQEGSANTASPQVSSAIESSSGKGNPLAQKTLHEMNTSFGVHFSDVRIHNDNEAVNLNNELSAQAFTYGNDIYFNKGKYNPENKEGKFLLAHELTHVLQQGSEIQKKQIQRSFWGTIGGVVTGAIGGFLVGGPAGAVAGGVLGGIAGDAATTHTRGLNKNETQEAQKVFGNSLNYGAVSVSDSSELLQIGGYARTPGNTVFFPTGTLGRSDPAYYAFLIHELTHTWQTQHGVSVLTKIRYSLSEANYNYGGDTGLKKAINDGKCFNDFNTEAQASILENYYKILTHQILPSGVGDMALHEWFVFEVQNLAGKCTRGKPGIKTDILAPKYRSSDQNSFT